MANFDNFTKPPFLIKLLELILGTICMGLMSQNGYNLSVAKTEVIHATFYGFFMVSAIVVISYILDSPIKGILMMVISFCAAVMYITAGALAIECYDKRGCRVGEVLGAGIVGLLTGGVYCIDCYLSWRNK